MGKIRRWVLLGAVLAVTCAFAFFGLRTWRDGRSLERRLNQAQEALSDGEWAKARTAIKGLRDESLRATAHLDGITGDVLALLPYAGRTIRTTRTVVREGAVAANAALEVLPAIEGQHLWRDGRINLHALQTLGRAARSQQDELAGALRRANASSSSLLPGPVARARLELIGRLQDAVHGTTAAGDAADLFGRIFGASGTRRYFIAFENPAENRGAGGLWGNYGILEATDGKLHLGDFGRINDIERYATNEGPDWYAARYERYGYVHDWHQLSTGPDFVTVAEIAEANLRDAPDIGPVHGTIGLDPLGLASMLRITGPVTVPDWPSPITADNVADVTMHDAYSHFDDNDDRVAFLGNTALAVWQRFLDADLSAASILRSGLGGAIATKHLRLHFVDDREQRLVSTLGASGDMRNDGNMFALVTQNTGGNKMDHWLHRELLLDVQLEHDGSAGGTATITLRNDGPSSGEPRYVIGPYSDDYRAGYNEQLVRLYLPRSASVLDDVEVAAEQDSVVVEWEVSVPPGGEITRSIRFQVDDLWDPASGVVDLVARKQASIHPDEVTVGIKPSWGRRLDVEDGGMCPLGPTTTDLRVAARVRGSALGWVVGPWARDVTCGVR